MTFGYRFELRKAIIDHYAEILAFLSKYRKPVKKRKNALDVGCSFGYVLALLKKLNYEAVGVDLDPLNLIIAKKDCVDVILADAKHLPFRENSFEFITAFEIIEHLDNPLSFLVEASRVLRKGESLVVTCPTNHPVRRFYDWLQGEGTHVSLLKYNEWLHIFSIHFKVVSHFNWILLPIPPIIFNRYWKIYNAPSFLAEHIAVKLKLDSRLER